MKITNILIAVAFSFAVAISTNAADLQPNYEEQEKAPSNWKIYSIIERGDSIGNIGFYDTGTRLRYQAVNTSNRSYKLAWCFK
jgi:hypothetical protein